MVDAQRALRHRRRFLVAVGLSAVAVSQSCGGGSSNPAPPAPTSTTSLSGVVTDAVSGSPVASAAIAVQGKSATTGADGRYSISGLSDGQATLTAQRQGETNFSQSVTLAGATTVNVVMTPALEAGLAGSWGGQWRDTPGSTGPASMTVAVNTITQSAQGSITFGGSVFGQGTPPPQTFTVPYTGAGGVFTTMSSFFGLVTVNFSRLSASRLPIGPRATATSQFSGTMTNVPGGQVARVDFSGTANVSTIAVDYTVTYVNGTRTNGVLTLSNGATTGPAPSVTGIVVNGSGPVVGQMVPFTASATFNDGHSEDVTSRASWSSSNPGVATVSSAGVVTGVSAGQATIVASFQGITGTLPIMVIASSPGNQITLISCEHTGSDASDFRRTLYLPSYPGNSLKEVDVWLTARDVTGTYSVTMTVLVNEAQLAVIGPVSLNVATPRQSVPVAFVLPTARSISQNSRVRFQLQASSLPSGGELAWEGGTDANCPVVQTADSSSTTPVGRVPVRVIGTTP